MLFKLLFAAFLVCPVAFEQTSSVAPLAFEIVSIRPNPTSNSYGGWKTTPDGFHMTQSIWATIMEAYFPQDMAYWSANRLVNEPKWLRDKYTIDARVSEADREAWQTQGSTLDKKPLLSAMLQTMLAERCKFTFHRVPGSVAGFALVAGKRGAHLAVSAPDAVMPDGMKMGSNAVVVPSPRDVRLTWTFHRATISDLVWFLSGLSNGHHVVDRTGLTGNYDFVLGCAVFDPDNPRRGCGSEIANQPNPLADWDLDALGLHLEPINIPIDSLVIDHIEKPSEN